MKRKEKEEKNNNLNKNRRSISYHKKDVSQIRGHFSYQCSEGKGKIEHHAHVINMEEYTSHKKAMEIKDEEYTFVSDLIGTITHGNYIIKKYHHHINHAHEASQYLPSCINKHVK